MQVVNLMTKDVKSCRPQDSANDAVKIFWDSDCGCVPVVDEDRQVIGMLTDRDVCMAVYTRGKTLRDIAVSEAMGNSIIACKPDDTIATAEMLMREKQVRRLPVVDGDNRLVGILSINDIACEAARERTRKQKEVSDAEVGETLGAICQRRS